MPLTIIGIDEAGYGPLLGPLCVGMAAIRLDDWHEGRPAPDLWKHLSSGVCAKPGDRRGRVAIADSKKLKLPSDASRHPLIHLERGVLSALMACGSQAGHGSREPCHHDHGSAEPACQTDGALFDALGVRVPDHPWYGGDPAPGPVGQSVESIRIAGNTLARALREAGAAITDLRCEVISESELNEIASRTGSKASATAEAIGRHLRRVWSNQEGDGGRAPGDSEENTTVPRVVIDRQGGRTQYGEWLAAMLPESIGAGDVVVLDEAPAHSRYDVLDASGTRRLSVHMQVEAEQACLCVALASMVAKLVREMLMARLNRYWLGLAREHGLGEIKPTAGYRQDGWRWLHDMNGVIPAAERRVMVRTV